MKSFNHIMGDSKDLSQRIEKIKKMLSMIQMSKCFRDTSIRSN